MTSIGFFLREQPSGTWIDEIPPWTALAKRKVTRKAIMDQCCTGLCDSYGTPIKKPTEMMANYEAILQPFRSQVCAGYHKHATLCNKELTTAAQYTRKMQSLIVDAVKIAKDVFATGRDPFQDRPRHVHTYVTNSAGYDLDDTTIPRHNNGEIIRPIGVTCLLYTSDAADE